MGLHLFGKLLQGDVRRQGHRDGRLAHRAGLGKAHFLRQLPRGNRAVGVGAGTSQETTGGGGMERYFHDGICAKMFKDPFLQRKEA